MQRDHDLLKKDNNITNIEDSNNNNDNIIKALNNHSDNSICLLVGWMIWYKSRLDFIDQIRQNIIIWEKFICLVMDYSFNHLINDWK